MISLIAVIHDQTYHIFSTGKVASQFSWRMKNGIIRLLATGYAIGKEMI